MRMPFWHRCPERTELIAKIDIFWMPVCRHSDQCLSSDVFESSKSGLRTVISVTAFVGIAFGCNYTQDLTYGKYLYCYFFKTAVTLTYESTEDVRVIRKNAEKIKKEEEAILLRERGKDPGEQRKLLVKLIAFIVVFAVTIVSVVLFATAKKKENIHHEAVILETMEREEENE